MRKIKRTIIVLWAMMICLTACASGHKTEMEPENTRKEWAVYWYLCGSDLESRFGSASADMEELLSTKLPAGVDFVVETGGAYAWSRKDISPEKRQRFVYSSAGWKLEEELEAVNMGESSSLSSFLKYCVTQHDAERKMLILWNHGGGTLGGIAYDENYGMDSLNMTELKDALEEVGECFDIIGFDACLMANIDTICAVGPYGEYMLASEEQEPGNGWDYTAVAEILSRQDTETAEIGKQICDAFYQGCEREESEKGATLALIDLSKAEAMEKAFEDCGEILFQSALIDDAAATAIIRNAKAAENYGANSKEEGFTNMVDIGDLTRKLLARENNLKSRKELQALSDLIDEAVLYQVRGEFRKEGAGISCYYPLDDSLRSLLQFRAIMGPEELQSLYKYLLTGRLDDELLKYIREKNYQQDTILNSHITVDTLELEDAPLGKTEEDLVMNIGSEKAKYIILTQSFVGVLNEEDRKLYCFGNQRCDVEDWENGEFRLRMPTEWWALDGHYVYTFLTTVTEKYSIYSIPILLNGEQRFMRVAHDFDKDTMHIMHVSEPNAELYISDRTNFGLEDGDIITTQISYLDKISGDRAALYEYESFTYHKDMTFTRIPMPNGIACGIFALYDAWGNHALSKAAIFDIEDGRAR